MNFLRSSTLFLCFILFVLLTSSCARRPRAKISFATSTSTQTNDQLTSSSQRIDINTATTNELEKLPGIGKALAARIVEHREQFGKFRRAQHLIIVRGISDKRFRAFQHLITVE